MKARFEASFMRNSVRIWLYEDGPRGRSIIPPIEIDEKGNLMPTWQIKPLTENEGVEPPPTLELQTEMVEAIVSAGLEADGIRPPSTALQQHLADAREVRDRLLGMVEQTAGALTVKLVR